MKQLTISTFGPHLEHGTNKLTFQAMDHFFEDVQTFGNIVIMDAYPYEHLNVLIKQSYRLT